MKVVIESDLLFVLLDDLIAEANSKDGENWKAISALRCAKKEIVKLLDKESERV